MRDRVAGTTRPIDLGVDGEPAERFSDGPLISRNGRFVAFTSSAANLVPGDTNGKSDAFVRDLATGTIVRASLKDRRAEIRGQGSNVQAISADGRFVVFVSAARTLGTGGLNSVFVRDLAQGRTTLVSVPAAGGRADADSRADSISGDGRFVGFWSFANNLVANDSNGQPDVFVRDRRTGRTTLASVATGGAPGNNESIGSFVSDDGNIVAFSSAATNLAPGDANGWLDVFVRDVRAGTTERVSLGTGGGETDGTSFPTGISADGRYVLFYSDATNLVAGDTNGAGDVFVHDRRERRTTRVSVGVRGAQGNNFAGGSAISADGGTVAFDSSATNLVAGDTNGEQDVFVRTFGGAGAAR